MLKLRKHRRTETPRPEYCLNCGLAVVGRYCGDCGQENTHKAVSFGEIVRDFADEFIRIDSKVVRTLSILLFRPGVLTRQYVNGKRIRYISPFKMYLTVSAIFLILLPRLNPLPDSAFDSGSKGKRQKGIHVGVQGILKDDSADALGTVDILGTTIDTKILPKTVQAYTKAQADLPRDQRDSPYLQFLKSKIIRLKANPKQAAQDVLFGTIPNSMFFMLPIFALQLKVLYRRSRRFYIEHLIFALHCHTFLFLLLSAILVLTATPFGTHTSIITSSGVAILTLYYLLALHRVYEQSWLKTVLKSFLLFNGYAFLLVFAWVLGVVVTLLLTFLTP